MKVMRKIIAVILIVFLSACTQAKESSLHADDTDPSGLVSSEGDMTAPPTDEPSPEPTAEPTPEPTPEPIVIDYEAVKPNEVGHIMVIMYHQIVETEQNAYQRSIAGFKSDLQRLYDAGFRTISISDLMSNNVTVEAGFSPVVLSFDDGFASAFSLAEIDGELRPAENCAVDIINRFAEEHPDFGRNAIFYINTRLDPFKGAGTLEQRFGYLLDNGYEIGNHTYSHERLGTLNADGIMEQIGKVQQLLLESVGYEITSMAYPYGERPVEELRPYALTGEYDGVVYAYHSAVRVGQTGGSAAPNHVKFDPLNIPRVQGSDIENTDLGWFLRNYESAPGDKYISDGLPDRISVPESKKDNVNPDSIGDKELVIY